MKKRSFSLLLSFMLALLFTVIPAAKSTFAQCGCVCAMLCNNRCEFECSGCEFSEKVIAVLHCCEQASSAAGDTGPCAEENF